MFVSSCFSNTFGLRRVFKPKSQTKNSLNQYNRWNYWRGLDYKTLWLQEKRVSYPELRWGYSTDMREGSVPRSNPLPFYSPFFTKKQYPFRTPSIDKWYPFHLPCLEHCIPFNYCKCTVSSIGINYKNRTFSRLYKAIKFICYPFWTLPRTQMTDLPTLC